MLDHIILTVSDLDRSIAFYTSALAPLGIAERLDYDGKDGPPGHPDLKGFGAKARMFFWLRRGKAEGQAAHIGFVAVSTDQVDAAYAAAMAAGAKDNGPPGARLHYDPRATTRPTCWIRTDTALNSSTRAGSTKSTCIGLTIHSSRTRFAGRLNSGVMCQ